MIVVLRQQNNVVRVISDVHDVIFEGEVARLRVVNSPKVLISGVTAARVFDDMGNEVSSWLALSDV